MTHTVLILVRHGQTDHNLRGRYQGQTDVPMNALGRAQIEAVARDLVGVPAAAIYSSDLMRSRESALVIGRALGLEPVITHELRERSFGSFEGLTHEQAAARYPESWAQRERDPDAWTPPGGESLGELWGRVLRFAEALWRRHDGEIFVAAAHGGPMKAILCDALGAPAATRGRFPISNGSISVITRAAPGPVVLLLDDTCHLGELPDDVQAD